MTTRVVKRRRDPLRPRCAGRMKIDRSVAGRDLLRRRSAHSPHQGERECARRMRQAEARRQAQAKEQAIEHRDERVVRMER